MGKHGAGRNIMRNFGIFPVAPARFMRAAGYMNAVSSIFLGKDIENGFTGSGVNANPASVAIGEQRIDVPGIWLDTSTTWGFKTRATYLTWVEHLKSTVSPDGFKRTVVPAAVGEAVYQGARALKANQLVPAGMRKIVRIY